MSEQTQYAWAAGFFDGEGCVSLHSQDRWTCARIIMAQKDIRPLEHFRSIFQLTEKISHDTRKHKTGVKVYYRLVVSGRSAADVLTKMLPYLTLKRDVAEVALDLQARVDATGPRNKWNPLPDAEIEARKALVGKAKWLNSGRWAAAETKPTDLGTGCDSPNCIDDKGAEGSEMKPRLQ